jgi:hypothetical protein
VLHRTAFDRRVQADSRAKKSQKSSSSRASFRTIIVAQVSEGQVLPQAAGFEQRLADLEAQIERLNVTLERWRETNSRLPPVERRLTELTDQLETRLSSWNEMETRLQRDALWRFQGLERTIEREWASIRQIHEEPARQLREQAENLTEICVSTAGSAQTGLERAEARLATLERDLHRRIDDLARDVHVVLAELQHRGTGALRGPAAPWSFDEVTRLHQELREAESGAEAIPTFHLRDGSDETREMALPTVDVGAATGVKAESTVPRTAVEADLALQEMTASSPLSRYAAIALLVIAVGAAAVVALSFYTRANLAADRASDAQRRAERIAAAADERIEAARRDAAAQITEARDTATRAQITTDVLTAADLVRFNLTGGDAVNRLAGQFLWSRSRGTVFSASHLAQPAADSTYQIWLLTDGDPVSAGFAVPDSSGRITVVSDTPPNVPRPVTGVRVTIEPSRGSPSPTGITVLARLPVPREQ